MKLLSRLSAVLALLALAHTAIAGSPRAAETPIRSLFKQMTEAWNRGDTAGVAAVFKQDGIMIAGDGTRVATRTSIERYLADLMTKLPKGTTFKATPSSVDFAKADVAILTEEGGFQRPDDGSKVRCRGICRAPLSPITGSVRSAQLAGGCGVKPATTEQWKSSFVRARETGRVRDPNWKSPSHTT